MDLKFNTEHVFMLSKIVWKMDLALNIKDKTQAELGAEMVVDIFKNLHLAKPEFYELLSDLTGLTPDKLAKTPITELIGPIRMVVTELVNFIKSPAV